jgi:Site-specific recombinase XerD
MARPKKDQPSYLLHKPSGQARVRINGKDHYLGDYGSKESWQLYHQLLADECGTVAPALKISSKGNRISVGQLAAAYMQHTKDHYGPKAAQVHCVRSALRPLGVETAEAEGKWHQLPVTEFTPLRLQQVLEQRVLHGDRRENKTTTGDKLCRSTVNASLRILKKMFKWGVSQELVPYAIYDALTTVEGIRKGKGKLAGMISEPSKVKPAPEKDIRAAIKYAGPEIATMIQVQLLSGMRPDEVTIMRPCEIDQKGKVWSYRPGKHKNDWRENDEGKEVLLGPKAQKLLKPYIKACASETDYLFCPARVQERSIARQLKESGKEPSLVKLSKIKPPRPCYDDASYRQAVRRACKRAKVAIWTPNQLRHNTATNLREQFGIEQAQLPLGHKHTSTTEIYAEKNRKAYIEMMKEAG